MLQYIEIKNFRCFHETKIEGFKRINLIAGKNNGGKTSLLEAILFARTGDFNIVATESRISSQDSDAKKSLFYNFNEDNSIEMYFYNNQDYFTTKLFKGYSLQRSVKGIGGHDISLDLGNRKPSISNIKNIILILANNSQIPSISVVSQYDNASINGNDSLIEKSIKIIDNNLSKIRTFSSKPDILFLQEKGQSTWQPIYYYGDAIQKIVRYVATITSFNPNDTDNVLLLDEIENGLHYSAHQEVWGMLYRLAKEFNVQIFATTHSEEMIAAFERAAKENNFTDEAAYFEMARHAQTNEIVGIKHDLSVLEYELASNANIRGE